MNFLRKHKSVILYGISLAFLLIFLRLIEFRFLIIGYSFEIYIGVIALVFTALGIWLSVKLVKPKVETRIVERETIIEKKVFITPEPGYTINKQELAKTGLTARELEVLQLMAQGSSNQEIATSLFVSLNTVKTHSSKLFEKLEVKRRTQAVEKAKRLGIIS